MFNFPHINLDRFGFVNCESATELVLLVLSLNLVKTLSLRLTGREENVLVIVLNLFISVSVPNPILQFWLNHQQSNLHCYYTSSTSHCNSIDSPIYPKIIPPITHRITILVIQKLWQLHQSKAHWRRVWFGTWVLLSVWFFFHHVYQTVACRWKHALDASFFLSILSGRIDQIWMPGIDLSFMLQLKKWG